MGVLDAGRRTPPGQHALASERELEKGIAEREPVQPPSAAGRKQPP